MTAPDPRLDEIQAIPAEAVDAGAKAHYESSPLYRARWVQLSAGHKRELMAPIRAALEAAHPVLLAELRKAHEALEVAFDYGWREGKGIPTPCDTLTGELFHDEAATAKFNPYRAAVAAAKGDGE